MEYRVLARKYRPAVFADLIGQEVLVRTLTNAIAGGRIAHAFLLTGIRGVGKTTTARIIARALNCEKGPTITPCGTCGNCEMIAQDRHVDVIEMDAASRTGVDDIRELIETVRYLPGSARYKIYIIDEVHMLSGNAFNALLKTLEEPPPHVKFIFATTESRKIPVTILSRCQRFDLKRVDRDTLAKHLAAIAAKENVEIEEEALTLIAQAGEGSVRDALSLLDQAMASAEGKITAADIRRMTGSTDNAASFALLDVLLRGDIAAALAKVQAQYNDGIDPLLMVQDALETTHLVTRVKVAPAALADATLSQQDRESAKALADAVSMPVVTRLWQMLLKGVTEVRMAPQPVAALEMLLVRIAYAAQLPTPAEVIRGDATAEKPEAPQSKPKLELVNSAPAAPTATAESFAEAVALFDRYREPLLYTHLKRDARLVNFAPGKIEVKLTAPLPRDFAARVGNALSQWTGSPWKITLSDDEGAPSLHEQETAVKTQRIEEAAAHPLVTSALEQFPGAKVVGVKTNA